MVLVGVAKYLVLVALAKYDGRREDALDNELEEKAYPFPWAASSNGRASRIAMNVIPLSIIFTWLRLSCVGCL